LFGLLAEQFLKKLLGPLQTFLGEDYRLRFPPWISDVSLLVQPIHGFPVEALPRPRTVVQPKIEQS
jgi:hypothetical protein